MLMGLKRISIVKALAQIPGFRATRSYITQESAIAFDEGSNKIAFLSFQKLVDISVVLSTNASLLEVEIVEDGESISKTALGSIIGRAVVGNMLTGGIGALIGGATAKKRSSNLINSITVKALVSDSANPMINVPILESPKGLSKDSQEYKNARKEAEYWFGLITLLIREAEQNKSNSTAPLPKPEKISINPSAVSSATHDTNLSAGKITAAVLLLMSFVHFSTNNSASGLVLFFTGMLLLPSISTKIFGLCSISSTKVLKYLIFISGLASSAYLASLNKALVPKAEQNALVQTKEVKLNKASAPVAVKKNDTFKSSKPLGLGITRKSIQDRVKPLNIIWRATETDGGQPKYVGEGIGGRLTIALDGPPENLTLAFLQIKIGDLDKDKAAALMQMIPQFIFDVGGKSYKKKLDWIETMMKKHDGDQITNESTKIDGQRVQFIMANNHLIGISVSR